MKHNLKSYLLSSNLWLACNCKYSSHSNNPTTSFNKHVVHLFHRTRIRPLNTVIVCKGLCEVHCDYVSGDTIWTLAYTERGGYRHWYYWYYFLYHWYYWFSNLFNCVDCKHYLLHSQVVCWVVVHYTDFTGCYVNDE